MTQPHKQSTAQTSTLKAVWLLLAAAVVWGTILGVGAMLKDVRRGLIVFAFLLMFALFWGSLLWLLQRRNSLKIASDEDAVKD